MHIRYLDPWGEVWGLGVLWLRTVQDLTMVYARYTTE